MRYFHEKTKNFIMRDELEKAHSYGITVNNRIKA